VLLAILLIFAPLVAPYDPIQLDFADKLQPPSSDHLFGTDEFGRDIFSRVVFGTRVSLQAAAIVLLIGGGVGITVGVVAGFKGGWYDDIIMRIADVFMAFPGLLLAMTVSAALGASLQAATLAIAVVWWPSYARITRSITLSVREEVYIEAAKAIGMREPRIIFRHLLPNAFSPLIVKLTMDVGYAVLLTASLGFIGLGAQEPTAEWGRMVAGGRDHILDAWWYSTFPGLAIFITVLGFTWIGDGLRDWLDPQARGQRA
jgi:peptide/nickel transport system permease protein